jgi:hypothetical protein
MRDPPSKINECDENGLAKPLAGDGYAEGMVTIPMPVNDSLYYIFCVNTTYGLYYHIINLKGDNGLGTVYQKNIQISTIALADCIKAVRHGNGRDWWIITNKAGGTLHNRFYIYLVSPTGISSPIIRNLGNATDVGFQKIIFNSTSTKFIQINMAGFMGEYNFNRCTGNISLSRIIFPEQTSNYNRYFWSGAYSFNDSIFYASTYGQTTADTFFLVQFNLNSLNIPASADTLDIFQSPIGAGSLRLAPDGKIYFSRAYECNAFPYCYPYPDSARNYVNENLSVINYPNNLGSACDYQPFSFYLGGKRTYYGLPNNPNYNLGALVGSPCDSLTVIPEHQNEIINFQIKPNPNNGNFNISYLLPQNKPGTFEVFDINGRKVYSMSLPQWSTLQQVILPEVADGIYQCIIKSGSSLSAKKVAVINSKIKNR